MRRRVQGDDQVAGQHLIDGLMVEIGTVVALEHERWSMLQEELLKMKGHAFSQDLPSH